MTGTVLIVGGTGFIGQGLQSWLVTAGYTVKVLSRHAQADDQIVTPDAEGLIPREIVAQTCAVINLAGENIGQRWTAAVKERIVRSRLQATEMVVRSLARNKESGRPYPSVLLQASGGGYYGTQQAAMQTEASPLGRGFLAEVCWAWEQAAQSVEALGVRLVIMRLAVVLGPGGGALARMVLPFRWFVGGRIGSGDNYLSWIHRDDVAAFCVWALQEGQAAGVYNLAAPQPLTMRVLAAAIGAAWQRPNWTVVPAFVLRLLVGEMADEMLLASQKLAPARLQQAGYTFLYPTIEAALTQIAAVE